MIELRIEDFGCTGDGTFDNSQSFKKALEYARDSGGAVVHISEGIWKTGPLKLFSHTELRLAEGAKLSFIPEFERYTPVWTRWEGVECYGMHPCIFADNAQHIAVTGAGIVDGNGTVWWQARERKRTQKYPETEIEKHFAALNPDYDSQPGGGGGRNIQFLRPPLIQFFKCKDTLLQGITVMNSPFWSVHPVFCEQVRMYGLTVQSPHDSCNTDGIDIDSCSGVEIIGCTVSVGDDGIALKSGSGSDGWRANKPTCDVTVKDCFVGDGHGGIVIGSETAAGIHNVHVENCVFSGTDRGIRIKTRRGRGGVMSNMTFKKLYMKENLCPLSINMFYDRGVNSCENPALLFDLESQPFEASTPVINNIHIEGVTASGCHASAGFIAGLPESPVTRLSITDCVFETDEQHPASPAESDMFAGISAVPEKSFRIVNVIEPVFSNVSVCGPKEPFVFY